MQSRPLPSITRVLAVVALGGAAASAVAEAPLTGQALLEQANQRIANINTLELAEILEQRRDTVLIDVRTPREIHLRGGMIDAPRSYNITRGWLEFRVPEIAPDTDTPIVV